MDGSHVTKSFEKNTWSDLNWVHVSIWLLRTLLKRNIWTELFEFDQFATDVNVFLANDQVWEGSSLPSVSEITIYHAVCLKAYIP